MVSYAETQGAKRWIMSYLYYGVIEEKRASVYSCATRAVPAVGKEFIG